MDVQKTITVGITDLCEMLDLTRSRIGQLVKMGVIPKPVSRGCYDVEASVQGYINFLTADGPLKGVKRQQNEEYRFYLTKLMKNRADIAEMKLHRLSQSLIPANEARQLHYERVAISLRTKKLVEGYDKSFPASQWRVFSRQALAHDGSCYRTNQAVMTGKYVGTTSLLPRFIYF